MNTEGASGNSVLRHRGVMSQFQEPAFCPKLLWSSWGGISLVSLSSGSVYLLPECWTGR